MGGKSTAIKLLTGENIPQEGSVYKHPSVRLGYLAQHSFDTINNHPEKTANEYIRWRFEIPGEDREAIKKKTTTLTEEEEQKLFKSYKFQFKNSEGELTTVSGVVSGLTGLRKKEKDGSFHYQVDWSGKGQDAKCFIPLNELEKANKIVFGKLIKTVDEKIAAMAGLFIRPLTQSFRSFLMVRRSKLCLVLACGCLPTSSCLMNQQTVCRGIRLLPLLQPSRISKVVWLSFHTTRLSLTRCATRSG